uniref:Uncharacterized protein n=1 Tax=Araucaria cunninghamii TaxID=56994 RepID=A0A0D6QRI0_ARACU
MADPGFVSGLIGLGITVAVNEITEHIKLALYCKKELHNLEALLNRIAPINTDIQKYRMGLKLGQIDVTSGADMIAPPKAVNEWLKKLNTLVQQANVMTAECCIKMPTYNVISRYKMSKRIRQIIAEMEEHLKDTDLINMTSQLAGNVKLGQGLQRIERQIHDLISTTDASISASSNYPTQRLQPVHEPLIVGQEEVFETLKEKILDQQKGLTRMGVVAMGGAGKTLLLKTVLNSKDVQESFKQDLVMWLTVSHNPSLRALRLNLGRLVALQINQSFNERHDDENVRRWIEEKMKSRRFLLFLDDVWESDNLLEELGVPDETVDGCKIVVSTRDRRILPKMRVKRTDTITLGVLSENDSWRLFKSHAFASDNNEVPSVNVEETARCVCSECDGLPLAIKVIAASMAGVTDPVEWEVMLRRLQNAVELNQEVQEKLYNRLRLSYDYLGRYDPTLQLCYLYIGAFKEDEDMYMEDLINLWIGEGLIATSRPGDDPLEIGRAQANLLVDRCLIEASIMDADGQVMVCTMHDVLHDLALQIAEAEENCLYRAGRNLDSFPVDDCSGRTRISLMENSFPSVPDTFEGGQVLSMLLSENKSLTQFPAHAMATMTWVRVLDLGGTSVEQLPSSLGSMKQLVCLRLARVPVKRLPESISKLRKLQIMDLSNCLQLEQLPVGIDKLVSLRYLDLSYCQHLQFLPSGISRLLSLQYLRTEGCWQVWEPRTRMAQSLCQKTKATLNLGAEEKAACFKDLHTLVQLKWLGLEEFRARIEHGTMGSMIEMRTLVLCLTRQSDLPDDMTEMRKIRTLFVSCRDLIRTPPWFAEFRTLSCLILSGCDKLQELCALQKLPMLRRLDIGGSWTMKVLPAEFGKAGAFPVLERFWLEKMMVLEEIAELEEGAMPLLKRLGIGVCPKLKMLPTGFFKLKSLRQIQVYSCPDVLKRMEDGGEDCEYVKQLQEEQGVEIIKEYSGHTRLKEISKRMGNKYWWDRFVKEMWMNFHL